MAFTGDEGKMIDPQVAQKWIDNYQKEAGKDAIHAEFFGFRRLSELIGQGNAIGVRVYYAKDDDGVQKLIVVAVSPDESNIAKVGGSGVSGLVLDHGIPCPPFCSGGGGKD